MAFLSGGAIRSQWLDDLAVEVLSQHSDDPIFVLGSGTESSRHFQQYKVHLGPIAETTLPLRVNGDLRGWGG
jgi:hypothetical protein